MVELKLEKLKKPKNIVVIASIVCSLLCVIIICSWGYKLGGRTLNFTDLKKASYLEFLVAMAVILMLAKSFTLVLKVLDLQEKIPSFDMANLVFNGVLSLLLGLACILGAVKAGEIDEEAEIAVGVVFGWFALGCLVAEIVLSFLDSKNDSAAKSEGS